MKLDLVLVGGGLANGLIAYRLAILRPELRFVVLEQGDALGGNHTWSFHTTDLTSSQRDWLAPLVEHSWSEHEVHFPAYSRRLSGGYHSISSERFHAVIARALGDRLRLNSRVEGVTPNEIELSDGQVLKAKAVIDGRGPKPGLELDLRFQKFLGLVLELRGVHGLEAPILMDARVDQTDGYRFVYTLPLDERTVLIEDTYYSDTPRMDQTKLRRKVADYARRRGWLTERMLREEQGVLPIVLGGSSDAFWDNGQHAVPRSGLRAGLFHPTTGYSLPEGVRLADWIGDQADIQSDSLYEYIRAHSHKLWDRSGFYRLLNRLMFLAAEPEQRYRVLEHFYRLSEPLVERFYAGTSSLIDRARVLSGPPPVPLARALRVIAGMAEGAPDADTTTTSGDHS